MPKLSTKIRQKLEETRDLGITELDLSNHHRAIRTQGEAQLNYIPKEIFQLTHLKKLNLSGNSLKEIPEEISKLQNLTDLNLGSNYLNNLPSSIAELQNLRAIYLSDNRFSELPKVFSKLQTPLTSLNLAANPLTCLPDYITYFNDIEFIDLSFNNIDNLHVIGKLTNLSNLSLSVMGFEELPEWIRNLKNLKKLNLSANKINYLPDWLMEISSLQYLRLSNNNFETIPQVIFKLHELQSLYLDNFDGMAYGRTSRVLPEHSRNRISEIPSLILDLPKLDRLHLESSWLSNPPPEIVGQGEINLERIREYYRALQTSGVDHLYEAKLLIIGEGGAGKTTLAKKILDADYELQDEVSTQGIEVNTWNFEVEPGKSLRVNVWDFGGQEIYHATHQFFLTKRSLYLLVADMRKEDTDFYYWLNVVELLSDNSPLLIIKNEKQGRQPEINERQLRGQFTNLKETLATNLLNNRGLDKVLAEIKHYILGLPLIGTALPRSWVQVRQAMESDSRNYISLDEYLSLCQQHDFSGSSQKLELSGYLHDLGVCLHFQNDPILKNLVILKPQWGTTAVYKVLDNPGVIGNFGRFSRADLAAIWHEPEYADKHDELLHLMINFKLCYEIRGEKDRYIAPQLLTVNQPEPSWDEADNLILRYTYDFMPKGMVTRLIVELHQFIVGQNLVWKSGVVLEKDGAQAEVIEHYGRRELRIRVQGKRKKELLTIVMHELDQIHSSYPRLKYQKLIPCNCEGCKSSQEPHPFSLEVLNNALQAGKEQIECQKYFVPVNIRRLIDDVFERQELKQRESANAGNFNFYGDIGELNLPVSQGGNSVISAPKNGDSIVPVNQSGDNIVTKKSSKNTPVVKSSWANGSFYLFTFVVVIAGLGFLANSVSLPALVLIIIASAIFVPVIGAFQLAQDDRLSEKGFLELMQMVIAQLPLIKQLVRRNPTEE